MTEAKTGGRSRREKMDVAWREARALVWEHRHRLAGAFLLLAVGRVAGLVLPASSKYLIDEVVGKSRTELLVPLALAAGAATLIQAGTSFTLARLLGIAGAPILSEVVRWANAMPQYHVGHVDRVARIEAAVAKHRGLALAGNAYRGVGVPQCIHSGEQAAERTLAHLFAESASG